MPASSPRPTRWRRDRVRAHHETTAYQCAMDKRKVWVKPLFGIAKDQDGLSRFRLDDSGR